MKILFVLEHYYPYIGGAETLFKDLAEELAAQNHEVTVVTLLFDQKLCYFEVLNKVKIVRVNCYSRYLFTFLSLPKVMRLARKADFIHTTSYNAAPPAWIAAKLLRKKCVITFHEVWGDLWFRLPFISRPAQWAYYSFERFLLKLSFDHYVAVSDFTKRSLQENGVAEHRIKRIYNGLDYEVFANYPTVTPATFTYTYFGRLGVSKGLEVLLPTAAQFCQNHPATRLRLIIPLTPKGMYERVMSMIAANGLSDHVELYHELSRDELYRTIVSSSCIVIPSHQEGFCFVAAEAVALGVPIISSGRGALAETVSGRYLEMENLTEEALLETLEKAFRDDYKVREKRLFFLTDSVANYVDLYHEITSA